MTCPYLGLKEDPKTALGFPSVGNFCHRAKPIAPVSRIHQQAYCLSEDHISCVVFNQTKESRLPAELVSPYHRRIQMRKVIYGGVLTVFLITVVIALAWRWENVGATINYFSTQIKESEFLVGTVTPLSSSTQVIVVSNPTSSTTSIFSNSNTDSPDLMSTVCPPKRGWMQYAVKPTDSIRLLSLVFKVSEEDLRKANCMGDNVFVRPGQNIYVPNLPTGTPTYTPTPTPTITNTFKPTRRPTKEGDSENEAPRPTEPPEQPTEPPEQPTEPPEQPTEPPPQPTKPPPQQATPTSPPP